MLAREKHRCDSGSESLDNTSHVTFCNAMLKDVIKVSLLPKWQNDRIKNIENFELSVTIMTNSSPNHNTSTSKMVGLVHTLVRKTFPTHAERAITPIAKAK